jgi:hypothetical protein
MITQFQCVVASVVGMISYATGESRSLSQSLFVG